MFKKTAFLIFSLALIASPAWAAKKKPKIPPNSVKVNPTDVFTLTDGGGASFQCATIKGTARAGTLKKTYFTLLTKVYSEQKKTYGKVCKDKKKKGSAKYKKLCKNLAKLKTQLAERDPLCKEGPDPLTQLSRPLTEADIRYLYEKAAFGDVPAEAMNIGLSSGVGPLVDYLMTVRTDAALDADSRRYLDQKYFTAENTVTPGGLRLWALNILLKTADPFNERLAILFLHNLLATSMEVLTNDSQRYLMVEHFESLRNGARSGDYPLLLKVITRDPVMLKWLSGDLNTRLAPNENFARELMELFTIAPTDKQGNSNYSEETVTQVARACTGWKVTNDRTLCSPDRPWCTVFSSANFDSDPNKLVFEATAYQASVGNDFDVIQHIFANHPNAPVYLAERILKEYLNEHPSNGAIQSAAKTVKANNFNFRPVLAKVLKSKEFFSEANRNSVVRSPVEKIVSLLRSLAIPYRLSSLNDPNNPANTGESSIFLANNDGNRPIGLDNSGLMIGMPPTVFGWDNPDWANGSRLLNISNTLTVLLRQDTFFSSVGFSYRALMPHAAASPQEVLAHLMLKLNVQLSAQQQTEILNYMGNRLNNNNTLTPEPWDLTNDTLLRRKLAGVIEILAQSGDFQMR